MGGRAVRSAEGSGRGVGGMGDAGCNVFVGNGMGVLEVVGEDGSGVPRGGMGRGWEVFILRGRGGGCFGSQ